MVRDIERIAASRNLPFNMPAVFPASGLLAARIALIGTVQGWVNEFTRAVFSAQFADGADIADIQLIDAILKRLDLEPAEIIALANERTIKDQLRKQTERAQSLGIFGAPSFIAQDGELFWGDDRLDAALIWPVTL